MVTISKLKQQAEYVAMLLSSKIAEVQAIANPVPLSRVSTLSPLLLPPICSAPLPGILAPFPEKAQKRKKVLFHYSRHLRLISLLGLSLFGLDHSLPPTNVDVGVDCEGWTCWVRDGGTGMGKNALAGIEGRYVTSKAYDHDSLNVLSTFRFCGEALASVMDLCYLEISSTWMAVLRETWSVILKVTPPGTWSPLFLTYSRG
ncbi:hypothetical protein ARMGADRAFT_1033982 [Armillaria gallica]|uniref:Uncharacterized protein n=1 Tax=Armillaria gallica TaxID=47427 RepID=A0A2H3DHV7_ARMGA|nr:hypothetical protein ARMGADRAFT_1033982 [Armillaria gallica]